MMMHYQAFNSSSKDRKLWSLRRMIDKMESTGATKLDQVMEVGSGSIMTEMTFLQTTVNEYKKYHPHLTDKECLEMAYMHTEMGL